MMARLRIMKLHDQDWKISEKGETEYMLIARAPMRISFGGGGTDLAAYYMKYGGLVVSTSINKYFYAVITTDESDDLQVISADYRSLFRHSPYNDLFWNGDLALPRAILHHFGIRRGLNLFVASEVLPGTGLGSSSAAAVTMVHAISTLLEQPMTKQQIAELASFIEIQKMGMPIGKQDQYAASFGGLNRITFNSEGVTVEPLHIEREVYHALERRLMLFLPAARGSRPRFSNTSASRPSSRMNRSCRRCTTSNRSRWRCNAVWKRENWTNLRACCTFPGRRNAVSPPASPPVLLTNAIIWRGNRGRWAAKSPGPAAAASSCSTARKRGRRQLRRRWRSAG